MKTKYSLGLALLAFVCTVPATPTRAQEDETPLQNPALKKLYQELRLLFAKRYPKFTSHLLKDKIHFERDTRIFLIHEANKTGAWQDPRETRGPMRGGILCDITIQKGPYEGALAVPQTLDKHYFKVLVMAPVLEKHDAHVLVHLAYPADTSEEFLKEFTKLVNDFPQLID